MGGSLLTKPPICLINRTLWNSVKSCWHLSCDQDHTNCALSWQGMQNRVIMTSDNSHLRWGLIKPCWGGQSRGELLWLQQSAARTALSDNKGDPPFLWQLQHACIKTSSEMTDVCIYTIQLIVFYGAVRMWHGEVVVLMVELVHSTEIPMSFFNVSQANSSSNTR